MFTKLFACLAFGNLYYIVIYRLEDNAVRDSQPQVTITAPMPNNSNNSASSGGDSQEKMLSVSGKKKCSHCDTELKSHILERYVILLYKGTFLMFRISIS